MAAPEIAAKQPDLARAKLLEISPLTAIDKLAIPLLVVTGANDPRVPQSEADQAVAATAATSFNATLLYVVTLTGQNGSRVNNNSYLFIGDQGGGYENVSILKYDVSALVAGVGPGETLSLDSAVFRAYHNYIHPNNAAVTTVSLAIGTDDSWLMTDALYSVHATRRGPADAVRGVSFALERGETLGEAQCFTLSLGG